MEPWKVIEPHPAEVQWLEMTRPFPIGFRWETPTALLDITEPTRQLAALGKACFAALRDDQVERKGHLRRRFHRTLVKGQLIETSGTTIMVTGYDSTGSYVISATWDDGESVDSVVERLAEVRRVCRLPTPVARSVIRRWSTDDLPSPQLVLSNVIPIGDEDPHTNLGGYEGASDVPMTLCVGTRYTHLVCDHRLLNPPDGVAFQERFLAELPAELDTIGQGRAANAR